MVKTRNETILHRTPGKTVPREFVDWLLTKNKSGFGYAIQDGEELIIDGSHSMPTADDFMAIQSKIEPDKHSVFFFCDDPDPAGYNIDDICPFPINTEVNGESAPFIAVFMEGDFPRGYPVNNHTDCYNLFDEIVGPTLTDNAERFEGDVGKILSKMDSELTRKTLNGTISHRGHFLFMAATGDPIRYGIENGPSPIEASYDWGWVSNTHGYEEAKEQAPAPKEDKTPAVSKKKKFSMFGGAKEEAPKVDTEVQNDTPAQKPSVPEVKPKVDTPPQPDIAVKTGVKTLKVPQGLNNRNLKKWMVANLGSCPRDFKTLKEVTVNSHVGGDSKPKEPIKTFSEIKKEDVKTVAKSTVREKFEPKLENGTFLSKDERQAAHDHIVQNFDYKSENIPDPANIQKVEAKIERFTDAMGIELSDLEKWTVADIMGFATTYSKVAGLAIIQLRRELMNLKRDGDKKLSEITDTSTETKKAEAPAETSQQPKKKFSMFGGAKVA